MKEDILTAASALTEAIIKSDEEERERQTIVELLKSTNGETILVVGGDSWGAAIPLVEGGCFTRLGPRYAKRQESQEKALLTMALETVSADIARLRRIATNLIKLAGTIND